MKPLIKYISLLLFSGLILPFCFGGEAEKRIAASTYIKQKNFDRPTTDEGAYPHYFSIRQIIEIAVPMLKK